MPHWIFGSFKSFLPPLLYAHSRSLGAPCFQGLCKAQLQTHNILLSPLPQLHAAVCPTTPPHIHTTELSAITMEMSLAEVRLWLWKPVNTYSSLQTFPVPEGRCGSTEHSRLLDMPKTPGGNYFLSPLSIFGDSLKSACRMVQGKSCSSPHMSAEKWTRSDSPFTTCIFKNTS